MRFPIICVPFFVVVIVVFYLSWMPSPKMSSFVYLPKWLSQWADDEVNENARTAVPLLILGIISGFWLLLNHKNWVDWVIMWFGLVILILIAEIGQVHIKTRHFDYGDIGWGAVGGLVGLGIPFTGKFLSKTKKNNF